MLVIFPLSIQLLMVFSLGLDLQMKCNALGSLGLGKALLACSLTHEREHKAPEII